MNNSTTTIYGQASGSPGPADDTDALCIVNAETGEPLGTLNPNAVFVPNWQGSPLLYLGNVRITTAEHYRNAGGQFAPPPQVDTSYDPGEWTWDDIDRMDTRREAAELKGRENARRETWARWGDEAENARSNHIEVPMVRPGKNSGRPYVPPPIQADEWCTGPLFRLRRRSGGKKGKSGSGCSKCAPCRRRWRRLRRDRHDWEIDGEPLQTVVVIRGLDSPERASDEITRVGESWHGNRTTVIAPDGVGMDSWAALVVFHSEIPANALVNIPRTRQRRGFECEIAVRPFTGADLTDEWLPHTGKVGSGVKPTINPCRNVGTKDGGVEREYDTNDGIVVGADDPRLEGIPDMSELPPDPELTKWADDEDDTLEQRADKISRRNLIHVPRWLDGVTLHRQSLLDLKAARRRNKRNGCWGACIAGGRYEGPKGLIQELAAAMDSGGEVRVKWAWMEIAAGHIVDARDTTPLSFMPDDLLDA